MKVLPAFTCLYHATPFHNRLVVNHNGLSVRCDARKKGRIWLADIDVMPYVCDHLTGRQGRSLALWAVFEVRYLHAGITVKYSGRKGIFYVEEDISERFCEYLYTRWSFLDIDDLDEVAC